MNTDVINVATDDGIIILYAEDLPGEGDGSLEQFTVSGVDEGAGLLGRKFHFKWTHGGAKNTLQSPNSTGFIWDLPVASGTIALLYCNIGGKDEISIFDLQEEKKAQTLQ